MPGESVCARHDRRSSPVVDACRVAGSDDSVRLNGGQLRKSFNRRSRPWVLIGLEDHGSVLGLEFDRHDPAAEPGVWITTVVNNRADRVPRSRVFADILVKDISVDRHFLIGTNLEGMQGFLRQAREQYTRDLTIWRRDGSVEQAAGAFRQFAQRLRQVLDASQTRRELAVMLDGVATALPDGLAGTARHELEDLWQQPAALADRLNQLGLDPALTAGLKTHLDRQLRGCDEYQRMVSRIESAPAAERDEVNAAARAVLREWLERKIVVLDSGDLSGEQIMHRICEETPPGFFNRIMGMQNIKGSGLDLVYRWQAWRECHAACGMLLDADLATARSGLQTLATFQEFGQLCGQEVRDTIRRARVLPAAQREDFQAELDLVETRLDLALQEIEQTRTGGARTTGLVARLGRFFRDCQDLTEAVRRRRKADLIYRDLCHERISQERAALELRALSKGTKKTELPSFFSLRRYLSVRGPVARSAPVDPQGTAVAEQPVADKS